MTILIKPQSTLALVTIAYAVAFNLPYANLTRIFDYPGILREPAGVVMTLFAERGTELILTWHGFALAGLLLVPFAVALAITPSRMAQRPALAIGAAIAGALAGLAQAFGLWRWVFVVPDLARTYLGDTTSEAGRIAAEQAFTILNLYGGVAIGEHMGQLLTALFVVLMSILQLGERRRLTAIFGFLTAGAIAVGTTEGLAIALGQSGDLFSLFTIIGFLGLTAWLIATGITLLRPAQA
ncbi:DUF4386 family protein [Devosia sp. FKR38]|uniref:DUF4386 family protein n=1 Tax=Devosia sp. FKR38 TaxID=2562312 RepID=UPI0010C01BDB|nr:DUF4386 family protein [Devosia sp. FKR38]